MKFRPCIDIHNGKVKQIVGGSLLDKGDMATTNFVSEKDASYYAELYKKLGLEGGHVILLNARTSEYYEDTKAQAIKALKAFPGGLMVGGGITPDNALEYIEAGASHVIVTSYVFKDGIIRFDRIEEMMQAVGKEHLCLDLSCRKMNGKYYIVTDRWQNFTDEVLDEELIARLSQYCDEFLIHAVDVEGKASGIEANVVKLMADAGLPITYAGGVGTLEDIRLIKMLGKDNVDVTIGSALDLFGGKLDFDEVLSTIKE